MQPLRWGPTFCSAIRCTFPLPSRQHQTLRVTGWESEVHPDPLTSPFLARSAGEEGGRGEGEGASRNVLNQASVPPSLSQTRPQTGQHCPPTLLLHARASPQRAHATYQIE